jgi:hypothetical protein
MRGKVLNILHQLQSEVSPYSKRTIVFGRSTVKLTGQQYKQLTDALLDAYPTPIKLAQLLRFRLDKNLNSIALGEDLKEIIFKLIGTAEAGGWTLQLINATRESNPANPILLTFSSYFTSPFEKVGGMHEIGSS